MLERPFLLFPSYSTCFLNADSTKAWLEIYQLPKGSWLKEMEKNSGAAAGLPCREKRSSCTSVVHNSSISHCAFLSCTLLPTGPSTSLVPSARYRLNKSVGPGGWSLCGCAAAQPTFHKAFLLLGHVCSPETGFETRFPWSQC